MSQARQKWGWAMYDWANSAFATVVMAGFFPVFFKDYWNAGLDPVDSTFRLGVANSLASLLIVLLAPLLGAVADRLARRKAMLLAFALLGSLMTAGLYLVGQGEWQLAMFLYVFAMIGFSGSNIFYDSLLPFVSQDKDMDRISALGFSLGYLGGGLLLSLNVGMVWHPEWFGLADPASAVRASFLVVAAWWMLFSIPLFLLVEEPGGDGSAWSVQVLLAGFQRIWRTLHEVRQLQNIWLFLVAYWLYIGRYLCWPVNLCAGDCVGIGHDYGRRILFSGRVDRACAGWCPGIKPVTLCPHDSRRTQCRVLWFL